MTTDDVSLHVVDSEVGSILCTMKAYGLDGALLREVTQWTPNSNFGVVAISVPGIARVYITTDHDGCDIDDFTFNAVPEPTTLLLLGLGGLMIKPRKQALMTGEILIDSQFNRIKLVRPSLKCLASLCVRTSGHRAGLQAGQESLQTAKPTRLPLSLCGWEDGRRAGKATPQVLLLPQP